MAEFFLELFSEEVPASLQENARENILESLFSTGNENAKVKIRNFIFQQFTFFLI